jgi:thiol-disulfide isomerase/thioredoxin
MRNLVFYSLLCFILFFSNQLTAQKDQSTTGHKIEIQIDALQDTSLILGHYFNQRMYVDDTTQINANGKAVFTGKESLPEGIYVVYLPSKNYFDLLVGEDQNFSVSVDTANLVRSMKIEGAQQTRKFNDYQRFIMDRQEEAKALQHKMQQAGPDTPEGKQFQSQLQSINKKVKAKWEQLINDNPGSMLAVFLKGIQEVEIPEFSLPENSTNPDSLLRVKKYNYYRNHYFDNLNLSDNRLLRTPFFARKLENYFSSVLPQIPDTLLKESINVIEQSREDEEMFQFLVSFLFNYANDSQIMGMDKLLVGLAEKYYLSGEADWADEEFLEKLETRVKEIKPTLLGSKAYDLKMQDYKGQFHRLHEIVAPATILVFWETDCGHCKKAIPKLNEIYQDKLMDKGVEIFAVYTQGNQPEWTEFIEEHELYDFINVWDPYRHTEFRENYDIKSTPMIYVLGQDKKIIGKRIAVEDLPGFIGHYLKNQDNF